MGDDIRAFDFQRMFLGEQSAWLLAEVAFRTGFMFVYTLLLVRVLGKRGLGELSPFELLLVVALGSAVGDPMLYPEVPLLHAMVVVAVIVLLQRTVSAVVDRSRRVEQFIESTSTRLVTNGVMDLQAMRAERFARDELFMLLREDGVEQLGQVKRAYLEPSGRVSAWLFKVEEVAPGLSLVPPDDPECPAPLAAGEHAEGEGVYCCVACGANLRVDVGQALAACEVCTSEQGWTLASNEAGSGDGDGSRPRRRHRGTMGR